MSLSRREDADLTGGSSGTRDRTEGSWWMGEKHGRRKVSEALLRCLPFPRENANTECPKDKKTSLRKASSNADVWGRSGDPSCFLLDWSLTTIRGQGLDRGPTQGANVSAALLQGTSERGWETVPWGGGSWINPSWDVKRPPMEGHYCGS